MEFTGYFRFMRQRPHRAFIEFQGEGRLCAITIEHASDRIGKPELSFEQIPA